MKQLQREIESHTHINYLKYGQPRVKSIMTGQETRDGRDEVKLENKAQFGDLLEDTDNIKFKMTEMFYDVLDNPSRYRKKFLH